MVYLALKSFFGLADFLLMLVESDTVSATGNAPVDLGRPEACGWKENLKTLKSAIWGHS